MHIVMVNWARIWDGTASGGGVNGYAQNLAMEMLARGHDVSWVCSGRVTECKKGSTTPGPVRIDRHADWMGVRVFEVINSPVLAPSLDQFRDPLGEVSAPQLESVVGNLFSMLSADVVHFHNVEGFSCGCVGSARASGAAVVFSLHNYHTLCSQVYLMRGHRQPCRCYDGGSACETCIDAPDPTAQRLLQIRVAESVPADVDATSPDTQYPARSLYQGIRALFGRHEQRLPYARDGAHGARSENNTNAHKLGVTGAPPVDGVGPRPCTTEHDVTTPFTKPSTCAGDECRGTSAQRIAESSPRQWQTPDDLEWQVVSNTPSADPTFDVALPAGSPSSPYARRRHAMVGMLNTCDRVLAVSSFVHELYRTMGVDTHRIGALTIGTRMGQIAERHAELVFAPARIATDPARPIRLCFMGANHWYKGLPMLADALELLTPEYLRRFHLAIHADGFDSIAWRFKRLEPRLAGLEIGGRYQPQDVPWICGGRDLGLVPSVWWDNGPQTVMEFLACGLPVLGADLGGIPDVVTHGTNGLLHRGNDRHDLARTLVNVARDPTILDTLRAGVVAPKTMSTHADEIEAEYAASIRSRHATSAVSS